jgi:monovalent cation:H+ antiporter-2, CPA2 family
MMQSYPLITTLAASIVLAFIFGYLAKRLRFPAISGYLLAGVLIGPHTPGFVADMALAAQLAEIGIILLMFGVGLHFSLKDLLEVRKIALPGALFQMALATLIGFAFAYVTFLPAREAFVFGFSLSVASTVVLIRALEQRKSLNTAVGRIAVGWLLVEDIAMVLAIVLLPVLATTVTSEAHPFSPHETLMTLGWTLLKITLFAVLMIIFGRRFLPTFLVQIAKVKSYEIMMLAILAIALGFALLAHIVFGASFALGAFLAGMVLNESKIGLKAAEQTTSLRDLFAVIFFVSVGMLFDPSILLKAPIAVFIVMAIIIVGKGLAALLVTHVFRQTLAVGLTIAVSLAQIGEFSFIFASMARSLGLMPQEAYDLILAGALLSVALNPLMFQLMDKFIKRRSLAKA